MKNDFKPLFAVLFLFLILLAALAGCVRKGSTPVTAGLAQEAASALTKTLPANLGAVSTPTRTVTHAPAASSLVVKTLEGTSLPPIVLTQVTPQDTPTPEPTVREKYFPAAQIQILAPGHLSQLASPLTVRASVIPGAGNLVHLQLVGEDGRLIHDRVLKMMQTESGWVNLQEEIEFEINTAGESAMLVITTTDEFDRRIAQSASEVFLIQIGKSDVRPNDFSKTPYVFTTPKKDSAVKGGVVHVEGYAHAYNSNPIILELLTESGGVMETQLVKIPRNAESLNYVPFSADIPFHVDISTPVRLSIRQRSLLIPGIDIALSSQLLTLEPN